LLHGAVGPIISTSCIFIFKVWFLFIDGFRKVISNEAVNLKLDKDDMEFAHQYFVQGQEGLLELIKRKVLLHLNFTDLAFVND